MFGVNMTFISSSEVKKMYISWVPKKRRKSCICKGKSDTQFCPLAVTYKNRITAGNNTSERK